MRWGPGHLLFTSRSLRNSPPPPPKTPHQHHHLISPHPHYPPPLPEFLPQEHIMVIRRYVCIGINQQKSPSWELWHREVCLQLLINGEHVVVWLDEWGSGTTCRTSKFSRSVSLESLFRWWKCHVLGKGVAFSSAKQGLTHFLDSVMSSATEVMNAISDSSHQHYCHLGTASPPLSPAPAIPLPAWFIKLLWQFTLMLFPAT